jgi:uncharacterized protein YeaO (DUF488 family)/DNA-binding MarR family transcriptional regulator
MSVRIKRAYDPASPDDGYRVLVDRIWPRGVKRDDLDVDEWASGLAPTDDLRRWFGHRPERWPAFQERYRAELAEPERTERLEALAARAEAQQVTLVFGARDREHNQAVVLAEAIEALEPGETGEPRGADAAPGVSGRLVAAVERILVGGIGVTALALAEATPAAELTLAQWRVLVIVAGADGVRIGEIATRLNVGIPSASRLVRRLERRGLATAERDESDRRATLVRATTEGRRVRGAVVRRRQELIEAALHGQLGSVTDETVAVLDRTGDALARFA